MARDWAPKMVCDSGTKPISFSRKWPLVLINNGTEADMPPWVMMIPEKAAVTNRRKSTSAMLFAGFLGQQRAGDQTQSPIHEIQNHRDEGDEQDRLHRRLGNTHQGLEEIMDDLGTARA